MNLHIRVSKIPIYNKIILFEGKILLYESPIQQTQYLYKNIVLTFTKDYKFTSTNIGLYVEDYSRSMDLSLIRNKIFDVKLPFYCTGPRYEEFELTRMSRRPLELFLPLELTPDPQKYGYDDQSSGVTFIILCHSTEFQ